MFKLEILDKYWLPGMPEETDLCLHGEVRVRIDDDVLEDEVSLSAAALHLLRSVTEDHELDCLAKLFPTDGFCWTPDGEGSIYLGGCPNGGIDGYDFYKGIIKYWSKKLKKGGHIAFELGEGQFEFVSELLKNSYFTDIKGYLDLGNTTRAVTAVYNP